MYRPRVNVNKTHPDSLDARLFPFVVLAVAPAVTMDEATSLTKGTMGLHVEYAEQRIKYGILFIFSPLYEYSHLEYEHVPVIYRAS